MEKKRDREQGGILGGVAELFDLPVDVVAGLPRLELIGNRQLYLERHTGLLAYSDTQIDANTGSGVLRIRGERLTLVAMTARGTADRREDRRRGVGVHAEGAYQPGCGDRCGCRVDVSPTRNGC